MNGAQTLIEPGDVHCRQPSSLIDSEQPFCAWDESYRVGIPKVDEQHKALFSTLNRLHGHLLSHSTPALIDEELSNLAHLTRMHFDTEEEIMQAYEVPDYELHKSMHHILLQQLDDVQALAANDYRESWIERLELADFLYMWLVSHINDEDKKIGAFVRGNKAG